jgi:hypothetical protein
MYSQTPQSIRRIPIAVGIPLFSLLIILILLSDPGSAAPSERPLTDLGPNLILNPGFDIPGSSNDMPADWVPVVIWHWPGYLPQLDRVEEIYVSEPASARIWHTGLIAQSAWESKSVLVMTDTLYQLQGYIRTQSLLGIAYIEVTFLNVAGETVGHYSTPAVMRTSDWVTVAVSARSPYSAVRALVRCKVEGTGVAWFDNISLRQEDWYPPRLGIEKATERTIVGLGEELPFTLTWSNVGGSPASTILITDRSAYLDFLGADPPAQEVNGALVWEIAGPIQPGATGIINVQARVTDNVPYDVSIITNCAYISSPETPVVSHCVSLDLTRSPTGSVKSAPEAEHHEVFGPDLPQTITLPHILTNTSQVPIGVVFKLASPVYWGTVTPRLPYTIPCCIYPGEQRPITFTVTISKVSLIETTRNPLKLELQVVPTTTPAVQTRIVHTISIRWIESLLPCTSRRWPLICLCNGDFSDSFPPCWHPSHTGGQPDPRRDWTIYGDAQPSALFGDRDLGDTKGEEIVPVGCSILRQENVYVPDTSSAVLAFKWHMVTYDVLCDDVKCPIDSLDVYVDDGASNTLVFQEGNPCIRTSQHRHAMDWCDPQTVDSHGMRHDVISLASWRGKEIRLTFMLCNRDYPNTQPDVDLYNSWANIDDVEILEEGTSTERCWVWTQCPYGKRTP